MPLVNIKMHVDLTEEKAPKHLQKGVYQISHHRLWECSPELAPGSNSIRAPELPGGVPHSGLVDQWEDVLDLVDFDADPGRYFCVSVREYRSDDQPEDGGLVWWKTDERGRVTKDPTGPYLGAKTRLTDSLRNEPNMDVVWKYRVLELPSEKHLSDIRNSGKKEVERQARLQARRDRKARERAESLKIQAEMDSGA